MRLTSIYLLVLLLAGDLFSQTTDSSQVNLLDSVLTEEEFLLIVTEHHPVVKQAQLMEAQGEAIVRSSRGGFDPKVFYDFTDKNSFEKNYYDLAHVGLKVPTWYGVEFKTGWEYAYGQYTNPMDYTPSEGLGYVGVGVNIGQGLMIDKRRASLLKSKQYQQMTENERNNMVNDLLRDAIYQYWEWAAACEKYLLLTQTLKHSQDRFVGVRQSFFIGELSVLDTLEAFTQIQAVHTEVFEANAVFLQETFELNNYLWAAGDVPLVVENLFPEPLMDKITSVGFNDNFNFANTMVKSHPAILSYQNKLEALSIDKKLKADMLKPKINLNYSLVTNNYELDPGKYTTSNSKWGINVSMPIFLRQERGQLQLAKIKIRQQQLKMKYKEQEIIAKTKTYQAKVDALQNQSKVYKQAVDGYQILLDQEEVKMELGESSLFKLTLREIKTFRANLKLVDLHLKLIKAKIAFIHSSGTLYLEHPVPDIN
ncbi:TolC family protein [Cyclobacteriaceae bacterium]|nr:TolC family protein [Cyclobacteriaceae bacterium]